MGTYKTDVLIVGAGPCGLGAATRLEGLRAEADRVPSYLLVDAGTGPGGCAASVRTPEGFTFDYGGHVLFPHQHYQAFLDAIHDLVDWHLSVPKRGMLFDGELIPYPVQRNIHRLPFSQAISCLVGLTRVRAKSRLRARGAETATVAGQTLGEFLRAEYGVGMTNLILGPLNEKMWACSIDDLESSWVRHRSGSSVPNVADVSIPRLLRNLLLRRDDPGWSSETRVRYPARGGTGIIWSRIAERVPRANLILGKQLIRVDSKNRLAHFSDGMTVRYGILISSIPLDILLRSIIDRPDLNEYADGLVFSSAHLWGLGVEGAVPETLLGVHSFHVPQPDIPFWRVNFPAAFSPGNVPDERKYWSVLCEVSESNTPANGGPSVGRQADVIVEALRRVAILPPEGRVISRWHASVEHGYPTPFLGRDSLLPVIQARLREIDIFSRGRFGGWRYEVSNQDHSFMQGVEVVDYIIFGAPEATYAWPNKG